VPLFVKQLKIENFRNLQQVELFPHPRLNFLTGPNGAGKTSVIESIVVLSRGRSFRTTQAEDLVGPRAGYFRVFAETQGKKGRTNRLGLERAGKFWKARLDGADVQQLSRLLQSLPVVLMEPNSHLLVSGSPEIRRKYLDRGLFHVEQRFLNVWRQYSKILKQRNAALRKRQVAVLDGLDQLASEIGAELGRQRQAHFNQISERVSRLLEQLNKDDIEVDLEYQDGWHEKSLMEALVKGRKRDLDQGMTASGPHRADIQIKMRGRAAKTRLSGVNRKWFPPLFCSRRQKR
jgi:DNA replication and repair protein RecF